NTAAPIICKPIEHGAHIVIHSTTKYIGGHGTSIGGIILDSGSFDWEGNAARFPLLNQPDASYHGAVWVEAVKPLGPIAFILKARVTVQRDYGFALSPQNAFQFIQGLETLALRFERQNENAAKVADYLSNHPNVVRVIYATAQEGAALERAGKYLDGGAGALVGFEHKGGLEAGKAFINALGMLYHVANIGDNRSLAIHPASTTHSQLPPEQQAVAGVTPGYVRLSIGIEHADDIIADIDQALNAATSNLAVAA
ncbi:MAG: PLP-dependent transferase, partial [Pseudomonadota bacterium]|nr:PLP-dependent transferase [Pseudomonadota bacterium]